MALMSPLIESCQRGVVQSTMSGILRMSSGPLDDERRRLKSRTRDSSHFGKWYVISIDGLERWWHFLSVQDGLNTGMPM
jgi:hypothetical protein